MTATLQQPVSTLTATTAVAVMLDFQEMDFIVLMLMSVQICHAMMMLPVITRMAVLNVTV